MKFKVASVAKNVRLPKDFELLGEADGERGDVVIVKLVKAKGAHVKAIRGPNDEAFEPREGDFYLSCLTKRYAPKVMRSEIPEHPRKGDVLDVISRGGAVSNITETVPGLVSMRAEFQGFVSSGGRKLNIRDFSLPVAEVKKVPRLIFSIGVVEGCGKTTTNEYLTYGLVKKGYVVCVGKVTGQGNPHDVKLSEYRGAKKVHGIVDAGTPSTVGYSLKELEDVFMRVFSNLAKENPDFLIIEMADGVTQRETRMLLGSKLCRKYGGKYILSCQDPPGAYGGMRILRERYGVKPMFISGKGAISSMMRSEIEELTGLKAFNPVTQPEEIAEHIEKAYRL